MVVRRVPKLARYQTALRPALSILRLLARSMPAGKGGKCEHSRILRPNLVTIQAHEVAKSFRVTLRCAPQRTILPRCPRSASPISALTSTCRSNAAAGAS